MKFCKDCKYFQVFSTAEDPDAELYSQCSAKAKVRINPVSGIEHKELVPCHIMRTLGYECGPNGTLFEPREAA